MRVAACGAEMYRLVVFERENINKESITEAYKIPSCYPGLTQIHYTNHNNYGVCAAVYGQARRQESLNKV